MSRCLFLLPVVLFSLPLFGQVAIGQWRDHLPYNKGVQVADAGEWIYAATESGLFKHHKTEGDVVRISKVSGLSDIGFSSIVWSQEHNTLIVAYDNTNIDLIQDGQIINVPDIKNKQILGLKTINNIHVNGDYAYLACGFGIVVMDIIKHEIKDSYSIGSAGTALKVNDAVVSGDRLYAATESGVLYGLLNGINLADFANWNSLSDIPNGEYVACTWFNNRLYVGLSVENEIDTVYWMENGQWKRFTFEVEPQEIRALESTEDRLIVVVDGASKEFKSNHDRYRVAHLYGENQYANPNHATIDNDNVMWIADRDRGLIRYNEDFSYDFISINGPSGPTSTDIDIWDGNCYVASGSITPTWGNGYNSQGIFVFKDNQWFAIGPGSFEQTNGTFDYLRVSVDPFDSKRVYVGSYGSGVIEYYDNQFSGIYNTSNSTLQDLTNYPGNIRCIDVEIDRATGNLWVSNGEAENTIHLKEPNGTWHGFKMQGADLLTLADIAIDGAGQAWVMAPRGKGLFVFNHGGTLDNPNDDQSIRLTQSTGNGNLVSNEVFCLAADLDGEIWVGTNSGISVFYSPESVFSGGDFDAQQILIEQDGYTQYLLENESITVIEIDGANRKWIGTSNAGVYLLSDDGTEQIHHFTSDNSPLFSNQITAIGVDHLSGEVFIGTDKGIISYKSTATWGTQEFEKADVYAYPNPVEPDYDGLIAIKGLVRDADVKIADAAGNVVFATTAEGGQAVWDGNNLTGGRAQSGVYLVFASNEDGKETFVTKILFIN